jgi:hypothetical protein
MGFIIPILDQSSKLTCAICGHSSRSGVSRFMVDAAWGICATRVLKMYPYGGYRGSG